MGRDIKALAYAVCVVALLTAGCAKKPVVEEQPVSAEPESLKSPGLAGTVVAVNVYDERPRVSEEGRLLHMPETTIVGDRDDVYPPLGDSVERLVRLEATQHFVPGAARLEVDVYVTAGQQSFRVDEMREVADVSFSVRIEIVAAGAHDVRAGEGAAELSSAAVDLDRAEVESMYVETMRESVRRAFRDASGRGSSD